MSRPCTRRRSTTPARTISDRLQPGRPTAPEGDRLPLLPSGPDGVHGPSLRGTRLSTSVDVIRRRGRRPRPGVQSRCSGLRVQGTASSPPSTALAMVVERPTSVNWEERDGGEGGIRTPDGLPRTAFPMRRHRPLGDLSAGDAGHLIVRRRDEWRRGRDSNPRCYSHTAFRERHLKPLGHLSVRESSRRNRRSGPRRQDDR